MRMEGRAIVGQYRTGAYSQARTLRPDLQLSERARLGGAHYAVLQLAETGDANHPKGEGSQGNRSEEDPPMDHGPSMSDLHLGAWGGCLGPQTGVCSEDRLRLTPGRNPNNPWPHPKEADALTLVEETVARIKQLDASAMGAMHDRLDQLTKPTGSLGRLEVLAIQLAGIQASIHPSVERRLVVVAAGDHGVAKEGVSAYPSEVTGQMLGLFALGRAAINAIARVVGADITLVDAGVAHAPEAGEQILHLGLGAGTRNLRREAAMSREQATAALEAGIRLAEEAAGRGVDLLVTGDMGIGNTTSAAAIISVLTGTRSDEVVGLGTGIDEVTFARKRAVVREALSLHQLDPKDPTRVLAAVGGFEIGTLAGVILGAAASRRPVVLDGVVSGAAALIAFGLAPMARGYMIAGHCSTEPGHRVALKHLGLEPLLELDLRLGEGTGATLALPLIESAVAIVRDMWTFGEAGVAQREQQ